MDSPTHSPRSDVRPTRRTPAWWVPTVFMGLAAWLVFAPPGAPVPVESTAPFDRARIDPSPVRSPLGDPPRVMIDGYERVCQECHKLFESAPETPRRLTQHTQLVLDHGLNDRCFNCHDRDNRNRLALPGTRTVAFTEVDQLCGKCHGPTWRDWQQGMHGRVDGYWLEQAGASRRLTCTHCHDPHAPAFGALVPLPGPNTLRMGPQPHHEEAGPEQPNPLRKWATPHPAATEGTGATEAEDHP